MEYSYLLDLADECEDPYMRLMYASKYSFMCVLHCLSVFVLVSLFLCVYVWSETYACWLQQHGLYLSTMRSKEPGNHLIQFLVRLMKWLIMVALHSYQNR